MESPIETVSGFEEIDPAGLECYLRIHRPKIAGIGPGKAKLIADRFGRNFDSVIRKNPLVIAKAASLSSAAVEELRKS